MRGVAAAGVDGARSAFAHGMTVATNALLERRGARTALIDDRGLPRRARDRPPGRAPTLYDLAARPPAAARAARAALRRAASGWAPDGVIEPLDEESARAAVEAVAAADVEAVAVCLLFGFLHPEHERRVGELLRERLPGVHVSLSSRGAARSCASTSAARRPRPTPTSARGSARTCGRLGERAPRRRAAGAARDAVVRAGWSALGTRGGRGAAACCFGAGRRRGRRRPRGARERLRRRAELRHGRHQHRRRADRRRRGADDDRAAMVGGRADAGCRWSTSTPSAPAAARSRGRTPAARCASGRASAGADPGPAATGAAARSRRSPTPTWCSATCADGAELGGELTLERELAERALRAGRGAARARARSRPRRGVVRGRRTRRWSRALRVISVERGLDPREFALVAFGGAGGDARVRAWPRGWGCATVLVPRAGGVLSALGLAIVRSPARLLGAAAGAARRPGRGRAGGGVRRPRGTRARRPGRSGARAARRPALSRPVVRADGRGGRPGRARRAFHAAHERRYGYRMDDGARRARRRAA